MRSFADTGGAAAGDDLKRGEDADGGRMDGSDNDSDTGGDKSSMTMLRAKVAIEQGRGAFKELAVAAGLLSPNDGNLVDQGNLVEQGADGDPLGGLQAPRRKRRTSITSIAEAARHALAAKD